MTAPEQEDLGSRAERWDRLADLFERASALTQSDRSGFLERECRNDRALRDELERMLRAEAPAASFLEPPQAAPDLSRFPFGPNALVGKEIGSYRVLRTIACGGMGTVYEAEQKTPLRRVALKVMLAGQASSAVRRFRFEAEILARLKHAGIAQIYEAGIHVEHAGAEQVEIPWLAMEHVEEARTVIQFAREHELDLTARLALILEVCEAVGYGHEKGVIHRDIKPSNLLVDATGRVKVIDFGIARARGAGMTAETLVTRTGEIVGTLQYMSPEQIDGDVEALDVRSDVYAIGLVLYELLCGQPPYDVSALPLTAVASKVRNEAPIPPRALRPDLAPELEWIPLKALEKEPARRYASARDLADDIRRFLAHEPVLARAPSTTYRLRKFARRHAIAVTAAVLAFIAMVVGTVGLGVGMHQAMEARNLATKKTDDVLSLSAIQELKELVDRADTLWPADPAMLPKYEAWLADAGELIEGRHADPAKGLKRRPSLAEYQAKLAEIRQRAKPLSSGQIESDRRASTRYAEWEKSRAELIWMRCMLGEIPWPSEAEVETALAKETLPTDADALNVIAWDLVDVDPKNIVYGSEVRALVLARRALAAAKDSERAGIRDTLSLALYRCGRLDEALAEEQRAVDEAQGEQKVGLAASLVKMQERVARWRPESGRSKQIERASNLTARVAELERDVDERRTYECDDREDRWWHAQLSTLVSDLQGFTDDKRGGLFSAGVSSAHGWGIVKRAEFARTIRERSLDSPEAKRRWDDAIASIAASPRYGGLKLSPRIGLLPIGQDPDSKLWEFAHLATGEPAERGPDGKLILKESMGLVLVLIPRGSFWMGAQTTDPGASNYDPQARPDESPVHEVELSEFLLSKYEMTQGQWERFAGWNPSAYGRDNYFSAWNSKGRSWSSLHPVEQVTWTQCMDVMTRLGLSLPSEAQWEYAARAGTSTVYWTGSAVSSLQDAANVADAFGQSHGSASWTLWERELDDGNTVHAAVGEYRANPFGLHDVHGNVWEWCLDVYNSEFYGTASKVDPVARAQSTPYRVMRGGAFLVNASFARASHRGRVTPETQFNGIGLRPAVALTR
jgi:formylglycine-generating enzyme required for sulfatase activity/serine/threonine protein kinase